MVLQVWGESLALRFYIFDFFGKCSTADQKGNYHRVHPSRTGATIWGLRVKVLVCSMCNGSLKLWIASSISYSYIFWNSSHINISIVKARMLKIIFTEVGTLYHWWREHNGNNQTKWTNDKQKCFHFIISCCKIQYAKTVYTLRIQHLLERSSQIQNQLQNSLTWQNGQNQHNPTQL